jgi:hypothetical protein
MSHRAWRATSPDGVAHVFLPRHPEAPCGARNQPERFDYPMASRCPACRQAEEVETRRKAS